MIPLPPGCSLAHSVFFELQDLDQDMIDWFKLVGGEVQIKQYHNYKGQLKEDIFVRYGKGKLCYRRQDGTNGVRIHFAGSDVSVASMFLIKFMDKIQQHNLHEQMELMNG